MLRHLRLQRFDFREYPVGRNQIIYPPLDNIKLEVGEGEGQFQVYLSLLNRGWGPMYLLYNYPTKAEATAGFEFMDMRLKQGGIIKLLDERHAEILPAEKPETTSP